MAIFLTRGRNARADCERFSLYFCQWKGNTGKTCWGELSSVVISWLLLQGPFLRGLLLPGLPGCSPMLGADGCFFLRTLQVQNKLAIPTKPLHVSIKCLFPAMPKATIVSMQRSGSWPLVYALSGLRSRTPVIILHCTNPPSPSNHPTHEILQVLNASSISHRLP